MTTTDAINFLNHIRDYMLIHHGNKVHPRLKDSKMIVCYTGKNMMYSYRVDPELVYNFARGYGDNGLCYRSLRKAEGTIDRVLKSNEIRFVSKISVTLGQDMILYFIEGVA